MAYITDTSILSGFYGSHILDCESYDRLTNIAQWRNIELALKGGIQWTEAVIKEYECETKGSLNFRKSYAVNRIPVKTPIQSMQNLSRGSKAQAVITGASDRISQVLDEDFDNNGNNWYTWLVDNFMYNTPAYGRYFMFASTPATVSSITKDQEKDFNPFVFGRDPLQVLNWRYENGNTRENGQFSDILFLTSEMVLEDDTQFENRIHTAVRITRDFVIVMAAEDCRAFNIYNEYQDFKTGDVIRAFENPIGIVPCRMIDIGESMILDGVNISAQAMNIQTASFTGTFDSNYNQKWVSGGELPEDFSTGENTVIQWGDPNTSYNITPNPPNSIENAISFNEDLQNSFDNSMQQQYNNLARKGREVPSGEALKEINAPQSQAVGYLMDQVGDAMEDLVAWMHLLAGESVPSDLKVIMPQSYESRDNKDRVESALEIQDVQAFSDEGQTVLLKEKWSNFISGEELEQVVEAEKAATPKPSSIPSVTEEIDL